MPNASMILSGPAIPKLDKLPDGWKRTVGALVKEWKGGIMTTVEERREEIVRCRDCAHSWKDGTSCNYFSDFDDGLIIPAIVEPDGFCAWGRKRES